jgi:hypothetical protein
MNKRRKLYALIIISAITAAAAFAEAPELRNVMPNSWQNLTRLTAEAERNFFTENAQLMDTIAQYFRMYPDSLFGKIALHRKVYKEIAGSDIFYRIIFTETATPQFDNWGHQFVQALVYESNTGCILITMETYNGMTDSQYGWSATYSSVDIIRSNGRAKGVLVTLLEVPLRWDENSQSFGAYLVRHPLNQPEGDVRSLYYLMSDISENMEFAGGSMLHTGIPNITIYALNASNCLVDPRSPLRYALQSAFDGNPATSYVANTSDALLSISFERYEDAPTNFFMPIPGIRKLAIVNGYAQNSELYFANNRIRRITGPREIELLDGTLDFQFADIPAGWRGEIRVSEIYRGTRYNDTCIAEFNIEIEQLGWLFGDLDE